MADENLEIIKQKKILEIKRNSLSSVFFACLENTDYVFNFSSEEENVFIFSISKKYTEIKIDFCISLDFDVNRIENFTNSLKNAKINSQKDFDDFVLTSELKNSLVLTQEIVSKFCKENPKKKVEEIPLWNHISCIGKEAFYNLRRIKTIKIPESVLFIDFGAFYNCICLKEVFISNSVKTIEVRTFSNCLNLKKIHIPNSVKTIKSYAFSTCINLKEIHIPNSVTKIGSWAFHLSRNLTSITLPDSVTTLEQRAFECSGLEEVHLPTSITNINACAFDLCFNLKKVIYAGSKEQWDKINIDSGNWEMIKLYSQNN